MCAGRQGDDDDDDDDEEDDDDDDDDDEEGDDDEEADETCRTKTVTTERATGYTDRCVVAVGDLSLLSIPCACRFFRFGREERKRRKGDEGEGGKGRTARGETCSYKTTTTTTI